MKVLEAVEGVGGSVSTFSCWRSGDAVVIEKLSDGNSDDVKARCEQVIQIPREVPARNEKV